jgi:hypothetical protein
VAEAREQFWDPEQSERPSLEAVTRRLVKTQQAEDSSVYVTVNCKVLS